MDRKALSTKFTESLIQKIGLKDSSIRAFKFKSQYKPPQKISKTARLLNQVKLVVSFKIGYFVFFLCIIFISVSYH